MRMSTKLEKSINSLADTIAFLKKSFFVCCYIGGAYAFAVLLIPNLFMDSPASEEKAQSTPQKLAPASVSSRIASNNKQTYRLEDANNDIKDSFERIEQMTSSERWRETANSDRIRKLYDQAKNPDSVKDKIKTIFPNMAPASISPLGDSDSGLYEVTVNGQVFLMSQDGNYIINHSYVDVSQLRSGSDTDKLKNVQLINYYAKPGANNEENQAKSTSSSSKPAASQNTKNPKISGIADFEELAQVGLTYKALSEEKGEIIVFSDFTCEYCRDFHPKYNRILSAGWTIHTVPMSRRGLSGSVFEQSNALYCMDDDHAKSIYETLIQGGSISPEQNTQIDKSCLANEYAGTAFTTLMGINNTGRGFTPAIWVKGKDGLLEGSEFMRDVM